MHPAILNLCCSSCAEMDSMNTTPANAPMVSIVMPVYNAMPYLTKALESLCVQTLPDFELICVDDGSTDYSPALLLEYASRDKRFQVIRQPNKGAAVARNLGMDQATGKYIIFLDADDWFEPVMLEHAVSRAEEAGAEIVIFDAHDYYQISGECLDPGFYLRRDWLPEKEPFSRLDFPQGDLLWITNTTLWNKLFLRSFITKTRLRFQELPNSNDMFFMMSSLCMAERIATLPERLITYRRQNINSLQGSKRNDPDCFIKAYEAAQAHLVGLGIYDAVQRGFENKFLIKCSSEINQQPRADIKQAIIHAIRHSFLYSPLFEREDSYYYSLRRKRYLASAFSAWEGAAPLRSMSIGSDDIAELEQSLLLPIFREQGEDPEFLSITDSYRAFLCWQELVHQARQSVVEDEAFALYDRAENMRALAMQNYAHVKPEEQNFYFGLEPEQYYAFRFHVVQPAASFKIKCKLDRAEMKKEQLSQKNTLQKEKLHALREKLAAIKEKNSLQKEKLHVLRDNLADLKEKNTLQNEKLHALREKLAAKNKALEAARQKSTVLKTSLDKEKNRIARLKKSVSWKLGRFITWPFRSVRNVLWGHWLHK